jgi:hypothetical protein
MMSMALAAISCAGDSKIVDPWSMQFGSPQADSSFGVAAAPDGDVVVALATEGSIVQPNAGGRDVVLARYTSEGSALWLTQFGGESSDSPLGVSMSPDGFIYVGGFTEGSFAAENAGSADVWLAKFDGDGTEVWRRQFGGEGWDRGFDVTAFDGGAYITGYTASILDPATNRDGFDGFAARFGADGNLEWISQVGTDAADWGQGSSLAPDGGLYFTGYTEGVLGDAHAGRKDAFVVRMSPSGDIIWTRQFGTPELDWPQGVGTTADGGVLLAGSTEGSLGGPNAGLRDAFVASYDADGNQRFITQFGTAGTDSVFEVRAVDGWVVATGSTDGDLGGASGERDGLLVWLDTDGAVVAFDQLGSPGVDDLTGLAVSANGNVFYSGATFADLFAVNDGDSDVVLASATRPDDE